MSKKKLREWEIPMNLSDKERKLYGMTTIDQLNNTAIEFLKNIDFKVKPRPSWLNSIEDKPNIFF